MIGVYPISRTAVAAARGRFSTSSPGQRCRCVRRHVPCHELAGCRRAFALWRGHTSGSSSRRRSREPPEDGLHLITETMARRHELSLESYDRLFRTRTRFHAEVRHLIALPLQQARQRGNTVFVDDGLVPFPDQWAFLAGIGRIDPATVEAIADQGTRRGEIIGLQIGRPTTWTPAALGGPSPRRPKAVRLTEPVPAEVRVVLAQVSSSRRRACRRPS